MGIVEFLEARIAEDEAVALKAGGTEAEWLYRDECDRETGGEVVWANSRSEEWLGPAQKEPYVSYDRYVTMDHEGCLPAVDEDDGPHIARHDPARVLREIAAKRELLELHYDGNPGPGDIHYCGTCHDYYKHDAEDWPCETVRVLASTFSDHPDFDEEWRP